MTLRVCYGVDPGLSGAIVALDERGNLLGYTRMPTTKGKPNEVLSSEVVDFLRRFESQECPQVTIEEIWARVGQSMPAMFHYGREIGRLLGVVEALDMRVVRPIPQKWQRVMLAGQNRDDTKAAANVAAIRLWPELAQPLKIKAAQGIADAALLAEYGRRELMGK